MEVPRIRFSYKTFKKKMVIFKIQKNNWLGNQPFPEETADYEEKYQNILM